MKKKSIIAALLLVGLLAFNWFNNSVQYILPSLTFSDINSQQYSFGQYKGGPTLVIFWATDCPGCIAEIPELIALHDRYSKQGLAMVAVAMAHDSLDHIKAMQAERQLPYTITWDKDSSIAQAFNNVRVTPTHFLINAEGEIIMRKIGELNMNLLHGKLQDMGLTKS